MPSCLLSVRVTPGARSDEVAGWQGDELRLRLKAPPLQGRANAALLRFLAQHLGVAASDIRLVGGATARLKRLRIEGLDREEVVRRLSASPGA